MEHDTSGGPDRRRRGGLLGRFALVTLVVLALLGALFGMLLMRSISRGDSRQAAQVATVLADSLIRDTLGGDRIADGVGRPTAQSIDERIRRAKATTPILRATVIRPDGRVVYSTAPDAVGSQVERTAAFIAALAGRPSGTFTTDLAASGTDGQTTGVAAFAATVPLLGPDGVHEGVVELLVPDAVVTPPAGGQRSVLIAVLAVGLVALFTLLLGIVWVAAHRLRRDAVRSKFMASHDPLTGLPNRVHLAAATELLFGAEDGPGSGGVLMLLDLDGFKDVNDSLGHTAGDDLLVDVAGRLAESAPAGSTIARLGGDEFAVVLRGHITPQRARAAARRMLVAFDRSYEVRGMNVAIDASVGIAIAGLHGTTRDELLQRADIAMYAAKRGKRRIMVYSDDLDPMGADVLAVVADLRRALDAGELCLHFQPKVHITTRSVSSVEALVRWNHPERGMLMPSAFIPFAERAGLIGKVTLWAIDEAVRQCRQWADQGHFLTVAINISQSSLLDPSIGAALVAAVENYGVPASAIEVEVTESALTADLDGAAEALTALHAHGVRISIDDYGTGYSSIAHLRALPVQCIKIDRSYVAGMLDDPASTSIVRSTLDLAHELGLQVVAEGVETENDFDALAEIGCDLAQGYYCARPMAADDLVEWLFGIIDAGREPTYESELLPDFTV